MNEYKNDDGDVLHCVYKLNDCNDSRCDFTSTDKYLQGAIMRMDNGKSYPSHRHIRCDRNTDMTHEACVVIRGSIKVDYYDEENNHIGTEILESGDCTMTFAGGHKFTCLCDDTLMYEFKNGPYFGVNADKEYIDE